MRLSALPAAAAALALTALGGCAYEDHGFGPGYGDYRYGPPGAYGDYRYGPPGAYGDYRYSGDDWRGPWARPYDGPLTGPGVGILDPWLRETREGRDIVTLGFREAGRGYLSEEVAHRANIWFRRYADINRDMLLTDPEIRVALVQAARDHGWGAGRP
jgi:hypothetical protein